MEDTLPDCLSSTVVQLFHKVFPQSKHRFNQQFEGAGEGDEGGATAWLDPTRRPNCVPMKDAIHVGRSISGRSIATVWPCPAPPSRETC